MRSKITINVDSDLLDILRRDTDSDLDSIMQEALAQFLGVKQVWVKANTMEQVSPISSFKKGTLIEQTISPIESPKESSIESESLRESIETEIVKKHIEEEPIKKQRQPKAVLKIWEKIKKELDIEFTTEDYWEATKKCGYNYKDSARHSTILEHLRLMEGAEKIVKISDKPKKYRKLEINGNIQLKSKEQGKESEKVEDKKVEDEVEVEEQSQS